MSLVSEFKTFFESELLSEIPHLDFENESGTFDYDVEVEQMAGKDNKTSKPLYLNIGGEKYFYAHMEKLLNGEPVERIGLTDENGAIQIPPPLTTFEDKVKFINTTLESEYIEAMIRIRWKKSPKEIQAKLLKLIRKK